MRLVSAAYRNISFLAAFALLAAVFTVAGCTLFTKENAPSTIAAGCSAVQASNSEFLTFAAQHPGKIDANGMNTEGAIMDALGLDVAGKAPAAAGSICDPSTPIDVTKAETTLLKASLDIANLLATWQK